MKTLGVAVSCRCTSFSVAWGAALYFFFVSACVGGFCYRDVHGAHGEILLNASPLNKWPSSGQTRPL